MDSFMGSFHENSLVYGLRNSSHEYFIVYDPPRNEYIHGFYYHWSFMVFSPVVKFTVSEALVH